MRIAIRGIGITGGFGCGIDDLRQTLISQKCLPKTIDVTTKNGSLALPVFLCDTSRLETFIHKKALRRVDHFSRMAVLASFLALEDAAILDNDHGQLAVVVATGYGATRTTFSFLDSVFDHGDALASPTQFSNSVHNAAAAHISISLKARGPNLTVSQFEMSVPSALLAACQWLEDHRVDAVLFGGVDEYCAVLGYCWQRFFGSTPKAGMHPLNWDDQSAIAGEGSAFFVLTRDEGPPARYGVITDIQLGHNQNGDPQFSKDTLLVLGADGHKSCGMHYAQCIPDGTPAAVYTPLYGSFPAGPAFDLAIAALSNSEGKIFTTPPGCGLRTRQQHHLTRQSLDSTPISCLKFDCEGQFGLITLAAGNRSSGVLE